MQALEISQLKKNYEKTEALKGISFSVAEGEVFGLLGPNGAGKTSLISILTTLELPTSGSAKVFGNDVTLESKITKGMVGVVPQELINHGFFTIEEVLHFHSGYYGLRSNGKHINYLLERLSLADVKTKKVLQLSGGMKRRFLIAKALVHKPKLLLLDEPTAGVDIELRNNLWEFVRELHAQGTTILLTTHYLEEAESLCQRVAVLNRGELQAVDKTQDLIRQLTDREVHLSFSKEQSPLTHPSLIRQDGKELVFRISSQQTTGELLTSLKIDMNALVDIKIREGRLEDAVKRVLGGRK